MLHTLNMDGGIWVGDIQPNYVPSQPKSSANIIRPEIKLTAND